MTNPPPSYPEVILIGSPKQPLPGEWYVLKWEFNRDLFYITESTSEVVYFTRPNWLSSSGVWMSLQEFWEKQPSYLGKGRRTLMSYIPLICHLFPRYKRP